MIMVEMDRNTTNLEEVNKVNCHTPRVDALIELRKKSKEHICCERSRIVTNSWKETEGEALDIRRAKLFKKIMEENPIAIWPGELIVGTQSKYPFGASPYVDFNPDAALENMTAFGASGGSSVESAEITEEERLSILEDCKYWSGRSPGDIIHAIEKEKFTWLPDWIESGFVLPQQTGGPPANKHVNYGKVINIGLEGIIEEAKAARNALEFDSDSANDYNKDRFLTAVIIACEGAIEYANRYVELAKTMAEQESDPVRKEELKQIAINCAQVPAKPARTFYEAIQSFWFIHLLINLETASLAECPARMDQYLYPLYRKDVMEEKTLSRQDAAELMACLFVKLNNQTAVKNNYDKNNIPGTMLQGLTICGVDKNGRDASNELSYMILEVLGQVQFPQPPVYVRHHNKIDRRVWMKALEVNVRRGDGNPAFLSDETRIPSLLEHGFSLTDSRDWAAAGCAGSIVPNVSMHGGQLGICYFNLAKIFEYVLHDGKDPKTGKQIGIHTGNAAEFTDINQFVDAFKKQVDYLLPILIKMSHITCFADVNSYRTPFISSLLGDCIQKGMDARLGGVRYNQFLYHVSDRGLQDVADSLSSINTVVFENGKASIQDIINAVDANFEGYEELRDQLIAAPKYGNDTDFVDDLFSDLSVWLDNRIGEEKNPYGTRQWTGRSGAVAHVMFGRVTGALPNGRKAAQPLADGFLSPAQGMDLNGPTAVFNSASKVNHVENSTGALMNMKFERHLFENKDSLNKLSALVENFFSREGFHIQINILDRATLEAAQENPQDYSNLMVRVAGYSAFFVDLPRDVQDEIMERTSEDI